VVLLPYWTYMTEEVLNYFKTGRKLNGALKFWGMFVTWEEVVVIAV
jgi:hypothetical protein